MQRYVSSGGDESDEGLPFRFHPFGCIGATASKFEGIDTPDKQRLTHIKKIDMRVMLPFVPFDVKLRKSC